MYSYQTSGVQQPAAVQLLPKSQATPALGSLLERSACPALPASLCLPLVGFKTPAGFPSPAADFQVERLDLGEKLELERPYVFMGRVSGSSMTGRGIDNGDLIVINRKITPRHGQVVVAVIDNELTCKTLYKLHGIVKLLSANPEYPDIVPGDAQELTVWGVVTSVIKELPV